MRLTGENLTPDQLNTLLREVLKKHRLSELSEDQAQGILQALSPLPNLRHLVWEAVQTAVEKDHQSAGRALVRVDAVVAADLIGPEILDRIGALLLHEHQQSLALSEGSLHNGMPG